MIGCVTIPGRLMYKKSGKAYILHSLVFFFFSYTNLQGMRWYKIRFFRHFPFADVFYDYKCLVI